MREMKEVQDACDKVINILLRQNLCLRIYLLSLCYGFRRRKAFHVVRCIMYVQNRNQVYKIQH